MNKIFILSERVDASGATGQRLKEGGSINKSLVCLGKIISTLGTWAFLALLYRHSGTVHYLLAEGKWWRYCCIAGMEFLKFPLSKYGFTLPLLHTTNDTLNIIRNEHIYFDFLSSPLKHIDIKYPFLKVKGLFYKNTIFSMKKDSDTRIQIHFWFVCESDLLYFLLYLWAHSALIKLNQRYHQYAKL